MNDPQPIHATLAARFVDGVWRGVLLRGPSGVGKSDLALRLVGQGWRLAADDRVLVWPSGDRLWGRAPTVLRGLVEVRGIGVLPFPALDFAEISVVIDCVKSIDSADRIPEPSVTALCGIGVPLHRLDPLAPAAPARVAAILAAICGVLGV